jgi:antitoxin FitA
MATITLKNIPDDLYDRLKLVAQTHHRSINSELINCLETILKTEKITPEARLTRLRSIRPRLDPDAVSADAIQQAIDEGRP